MVSKKSKPAPRRRLDPEARRLELLKAAERLIRRRGGGVRVEDVVAEAGAAKGTFYVYFASFDDLLEALRGRAFAAFDRANPDLKEVSASSDWPATMSEVADAFVDFTLGLKGLHEALFHSDFAKNRPPPLEKTPVARIAAMIAAGQRAGAFGEADPLPMARLLFAAMHEAADAVAAGADRGRIMAALDILMRRALAARHD